jgi:hypothetical protein
MRIREAILSIALIPEAWWMLQIPTRVEMEEAAMTVEVGTPAELAGTTAEAVDCPLVGCPFNPTPAEVPEIPTR